MKENEYEVIICWSEEDNAFIAELPELPGCAADGATYQEALPNMERFQRVDLQITLYG